MGQSRTASIILATFLLFFMASRFLFLDADPPVWMEPTFFTDEGEWADSGRNKALFGSYFADTIGIGFLMAPLYTWLVQSVVGVFGPGLQQIRAIAATGSLLATLFIVTFLWKKANHAVALIAFALLCVSPFFWAYGRVAWIEGSQLAFITASFALWFGFRRSRAAAFASGLCSGAAVFMKPSAVYSCLVPLMIASILLYLLCERTERSPLSRATLRLVCYMAGGLVAAIALISLVIVPNWDLYWENLSYQGGTGLMPWKNVLTIPGSAMLSLRGGQPVIWRPFLLSPMIAVSAWITILWHLHRSQGRYLPYLKSLPRIELAIYLFAVAQITTLLLRSFKWNSDHYYLPVLAFLAMAGAFSITHLWHGDWRDTPCTPLNYTQRLILIAVLLLPVFLFLKPMATRLIKESVAGLTIGRTAGISVYACATLFAAAWLLIMAILAAFRFHMNTAILHRLSVSMMGIAFAAEIVLVTTYYSNLEYTIRNHQRDLVKSIHPNEEVIGSGASTIFFPMRILSFREVLDSAKDGIAHPLPNPEAFQRLQPRYILEKGYFNYSKTDERYAEERATGYRKIKTLGFGPFRKNQQRYIFSLYEKEASKP